MSVKLTTPGGTVFDKMRLEDDLLTGLRGAQLGWDPVLGFMSVLTKADVVLQETQSLDRLASDRAAQAVSLFGARLRPADDLSRAAE